MAKSFQDLLPNLAEARKIMQTDHHSNGLPQTNQNQQNFNRELPIENKNKGYYTKEQIEIAKQRTGLPPELIESFVGQPQLDNQAAAVNSGITDEMYKQVNPDGFAEINQDQLLQERINRKATLSTLPNNTVQSNIDNTNVRKIIREEIEYFKSDLTNIISNCFINENLNYDNDDGVISFIQGDSLYRAKIFEKQKINIKKK